MVRLDVERYAASSQESFFGNTVWECSAQGKAAS